MKKSISILLIVTMLMSLALVAIPASVTAAAEKTATVSSSHVPADFDRDGKTDEGAKAIGSLAEMGAIAAGNKYYLTQNISIPATHGGGNALMGWLGGNVEVWLDGCGYTITFEAPATGEYNKTVSIFSGTNNGIIHVKNLNVNGVIKTPTNYESHVAVLAQHGGGADIENVVVDVDITVNNIKANVPENHPTNDAKVAGIWPKNDGNAVNFKNVHFTGSININCVVPPKTSIGGIMGVAYNSATFDNCSNTADIIVGKVGDAVSEGSIDAVYTNVGGIVGMCFANGNASLIYNVKNCSNSGNITLNVSNCGQVGGIVGYSFLSTLKIDGCTNSGTLKGGNNQTTANNTNIHAGYGGILGYAFNKGTELPVTINNCSNSGKITTLNEVARNIYAGGIAGRITAVEKFTVKSCKNTGIIDLSKGIAWSSAGGIVGAVMTYCKAFGWSNVDAGDIDITGSSNTGAITSGVYAAGILGSGLELYEENVDITIDGCNNNGEIKAGMDSAQANAESAVAAGITAYFGVSSAQQHQFGNLTIKNCANKASVTAGAKAKYAGGILGWTQGDSWLNKTTEEVAGATGAPDSKQATQMSYAGLTFDYFTQRTWIENCGSSGAIKIENASGKVGSIAGKIDNKFYLFTCQATGDRTVGTEASKGNAWIYDQGWEAQKGNGNDATAVDEIFNVNASNIEGLQTAINALKAKISEAEALNSADYTEDSWGALEMALIEARTTVSSSDKTKIEAATKELTNLIRALVEAEEETEAPTEATDESETVEGDETDEGETKATDENGNEIDSTEETKETDENGNEIDSTDETEETEESEEEETEETEETEDFLDFTWEIPETDATEAPTEATVDYSALKASIEAAEKLAADKYTEKTWNNMIAALVQAKRAMLSTSQEEIDAAQKNLDSMVSKLKKGSGEEEEAATEKVTEPMEMTSKGCGSSIAVSSVALCSIVVLGTGIVLKKKD